MSARRGYTVRCVCSFPGCKETSFYHYDTQRDLRGFCSGTAARRKVAMREAYKPGRSAGRKQPDNQPRAGQCGVGARTILARRRS